MSKEFFTAQARGPVVEIGIYDAINEAASFRNALGEFGDVAEIRVGINSPGGDISAGTAIYNMLRAHKARVVTQVDGLAASMASVIFMSGDERLMPSNSMLMIHNPWGAVTGSPEQIVSFGEALDKMRENIVSAYVEGTGLPRGQVQEMMDRESWLSAEESKKLGFATRTITPIRSAASFDLSHFRNAPSRARLNALNGTRPLRTWDALQERARHSRGFFKIRGG